VDTPESCGPEQERDGAVQHGFKAAQYFVTHLRAGKENVAINDIEPVGNYGIKPIFNDGHDSGIYSWDYLYELGRNHDKYWREYLDELARRRCEKTKENKRNRAESIELHNVS